jgi:hypothetical protein
MYAACTQSFAQLKFAALASIHVHRKVAWPTLTYCWIQLGKRLLSDVACEPGRLFCACEQVLSCGFGSRDKVAY